MTDKFRSKVYIIFLSVLFFSAIFFTFQKIEYVGTITKKEYVGEVGYIDWFFKTVSYSDPCWDLTVVTYSDRKYSTCVDETTYNSNNLDVGSRVNITVRGNTITELRAETE